MNTRQKMRITNSYIKKYLQRRGFTSLYLFPHLRYMKDYILEDEGFDAMGWKQDDKRIWFFQFKTNCKPTKSVLEKYANIEKKYYCKCCWITRQTGGKILIFND